MTNCINDTNGIKEEVLGQKNCHNAQISRTEKISTEEIPQDLIDKLEELEIPLDAVVRKVIASHDLSQVWGAVRHIENTRQTIKNPRSVFLYQLPKQAIDKSKSKPLPLEFLDWYQYARGEKVVDVPPEQLSRDQFGEPRVRPKSDPTSVVDWQRLRDDSGMEKVASSEEFKKFMEKIRAMAGVKMVANPKRSEWYISQTWEAHGVKWSFTYYEISARRVIESSVPFGDCVAARSISLNIPCSDMVRHKSPQAWLEKWLKKVKRPLPILLGVLMNV